MYRKLRPVFSMYWALNINNDNYFHPEVSELSLYSWVGNDYAAFVCFELIYKWDQDGQLLEFWKTEFKKLWPRGAKEQDSSLV